MIHLSHLQIILLVLTPSYSYNLTLKSHIQSTLVLQVLLFPCLSMLQGYFFQQLPSLCDRSYPHLQEKNNMMKDLPAMSDS